MRKKTKPLPLTEARLAVHCAFGKHVPLGDLKPNPDNPNRHPPTQIALLAKIIKAQGWRAPIVVSKRSGLVVKGHGRLEAARLLGVKTAPVDFQAYATEAEELADMVADNRLAELADMDAAALKELLEGLDDGDFDMELAGFDEKSLDAILSGTPQTREDIHKKLTELFIVPPFSVLDARQGYWQERKRAWLALGIKSELGRAKNLLNFSDACNAQQAGKKPYANRDGGQPYTGGDAWADEGTSVFDPVLCELAYRWFVPPGGRVLDPFSGGSVRGIIAARLGLAYTGIDLSLEQIKANEAQAEKILDGESLPKWIEGDSLQIAELAPGEYDFVFSCPPYVDLEVYSKDPRDLSFKASQDFLMFLDAYRTIIRDACLLLRDNRFACFVVGDVRKKDGTYLNFVSQTIRAFLDAGLQLYNDAILVTATGSLPIRAGRVFSSSRKLGKTHQNVLVFFKGDTKKIRSEFPAKIECGEVTPEQDQEAGAGLPSLPA